jgi:glycosyltransferase involved in cell wall biosynthesis
MAELVERGYRQAEKYSWEKTAAETLNTFRAALAATAAA